MKKELIITPGRSQAQTDKDLLILWYKILKKHDVKVSQWASELTEWTRFHQHSCYEPKGM